MGGNENESWKKEIYYIACPREGLTRCHLRLQGKHKVLVWLQKIRGKENLRPEHSMRGKAGPSH